MNKIIGGLVVIALCYGGLMLIIYTAWDSFGPQYGKIALGCFLYWLGRNLGKNGVGNE